MTALTRSSKTAIATPPAEAYIATVARRPNCSIIHATIFEATLNVPGTTESALCVVMDVQRTCLVMGPVMRPVITTTVTWMPATVGFADLRGAQRPYMRTQAHDTGSALIRCALITMGSALATVMQAKPASGNRWAMVPVRRRARSQSANTMQSTASVLKMAIQSAMALC
jgi:hypothetical protein